MARGDPKTAPTILRGSVPPQFQSTTMGGHLSIHTRVFQAGCVGQLAFRHSQERRARGCEIVLYSVYGDESHDATSERIFAVAGVIGARVQWDLMEGFWSQRLGGTIFHAADCESDQGYFANTPHNENLDLYKDLTQLLAVSHLVGYGAAIDVAAANNFFPDRIGESPYHKCFAHVLIELGQYVCESLPGHTVDFTFDQRLETNYSAGQLYAWIAGDPDWEVSRVMADKISFATRKTPAIQVADLFAREVMKESERLMGATSRVRRKSFEALAETKRFGFDFMGREYFQDFKNKLPELLERSGLKMEDYFAWAASKGLTDCWTTRTKYAAHMQVVRLRERMEKAKT
jgi:hypothetical protein